MKKQVRQGAASIYSVIVCAILFSVITVGFVALTVNEMQKTSEFSLSENALHSAEAGVEDVSIALATCASDFDAECNVLFNTSPSPDDCAQTRTLYELLTDEDFDEQHTGVAVGAPDADQAYTCIKINPYTDDYLGSLSAENSIKIIPLEVHDTSTDEPKKLIRYIEISWYSNNNLGGGSTNFANKSNFSDAISIPSFGDTISIPPTISASVYQVNSGNTIQRGTLWLVPTTEGENIVNEITYDELVESSTYKDKSNDPDKLTPLDDPKDYTRNGQPIECAKDARESSTGYLCTVRIEVKTDSIIQDNGSLLLILSLPYQNPLTDFKVQMLKSNKESLQFDKVQISVDSTGRANDVYSRIETRLENNSMFPIPDYAMTLLEDPGNDALNKTFYVGER